MKRGDLYRLAGNAYVILDFLDRSWFEISSDGTDLLQRRVTHVSCVGPDGLEEFPFEWFCRNMGVFDD